MDDQKYEEQSLITKYISDVKKYPLLNIEQEKQYAIEVERGCKQSFDLMVKSNLRLVISIALKYVKSGVAFLDIISDGNVGLIHAVQKFDYKKGYKLSTYATWWIKNSIHRGICKRSKTIKITEDMYRVILAMKKYEKAYLRERNSAPSQASIAQELNIELSQVKSAKALCRPVISLNQVSDLNQDERYLTNLISNLSSKSSSEPEMMTTTDNSKRYLNRLLNNLSPIQKEVLQMRYGLNGYDEHTLEFIARCIGKTKERVRQIQMEALDKLQNIIAESNNDYLIAS